LPTIGHDLSECLKVIFRQFHEKPVTAAPTPSIALNAADSPLTVVVDFTDLLAALGAFAVTCHAVLNRAVMELIMAPRRLNMNIRIIIGLTAALTALPVVHLVLAQQPPSTEGGTQGDQMQMMQHDQHMMQMHGQSSVASDTTVPKMPGQDAFGAIQEIVRILEANPNTDWSKVKLEALRQHLIDMNEVTLKADAVTKPIDNGIEVTVTGEGRTVRAIQRMVRAHAHQIDQTHLNGWSAKTESLPNGVVLKVTSDDQQQVRHLRGLGFIGVMVSGSHHQPHHLAMAKGEPVHVH
jgi:hypothetical protein